MGFFSKRNPNEADFPTGRKNWADVIKNSGDGNSLIWRQPEEDFNTNSTLIVMPGEEAIFIKDGVIEQVFENGRYQLSTENYPFISRLRNAFTGGISTFNCVVYFVRTAHSVEVLWGTPVQVFDKNLNVQVDLKGRGSYKVQVANPNVFLTKLLGNNIRFLNPNDLDEYFVNEFHEIIKSCIAGTLEKSDKPLLGVDSRIRELSREISPEFTTVLDSYGLKLVTFTISGLDMDAEIKRRYNEASMGRLDKQFEAMGDKDRMDILGDERWRMQQSKNILGDLANNPGAGGIAAIGAGLGMGMGAGGAFSTMAQNLFSPEQQGAASSPAANAPAADDPIAAMKKLKDMLDMGLIEQSDFDTKKAEIISRM